MREDADQPPREEYEARVKRIRNSDMSVTEQTEAISELRDEYYESTWHEMEDGIETMSAVKRYGIILGSGAVLGFIARFATGGDPAAFATLAFVGVVVASAFLTRPGLFVMKGLHALRTSFDDSAEE